MRGRASGATVGTMSDTPGDQAATPEGYDPEQDPDSDPEMLTSQQPDQVGENRRDPAEGPEDESIADG